MRIAIVAPPWAPIPPTLYGGIEQAVDAEARALVTAGHEVLLFTTGDSTCPVPSKWLLPHSEGFRMGFTVPELRHVMAAYDTIIEEGFDVVHDHTVLGPVYAERFSDLIVATTIHGPLNEELRDIYGRVGTRVALIAISQAQHDAAPDIPIARVIHHGINAAEYPMGAGDGDYVVFVGRLSPDKGAHRAIAAAQKAGVRLLMAGKCREPWETDYFDTEVARHLTGDIEYLGEVPHEEKLSLLRGARATLFPIRWNEPFGLVMIESLACGTPVLAFPEGAAPEVVVDGETGFLCPDETAMAEAIHRVGELDRGACRAATEGYFSTERMVRDHIELFEQLVVDKGLS